MKAYNWGPLRPICGAGMPSTFELGGRAYADLVCYIRVPASGDILCPISLSEAEVGMRGAGLCRRILQRKVHRKQSCCSAKVALQT